MNFLEFKQIPERQTGDLLARLQSVDESHPVHYDFVFDIKYFHYQISYNERLT